MNIIKSSKTYLNERAVRIKKALDKNYEKMKKDLNKGYEKFSLNTQLITNIDKNKYFLDRMLFVAMMYPEGNRKEYDLFVKNAYIIYQQLNENGSSFHLSIKMVRALLDLDRELNIGEVYTFIEQFELS
jgi:hypothetical protein